MNVETIKYLVGFLLPPIIDIVNKKVSNSILRFWVAMLVCVLVGILFNLDKLHDLPELLGNLALIFAEAQVVYKTYWENSQPRDKMLRSIK